MQNRCPECGTEVNADNPLQRYEHDPQNRSMCASCVHTWATRVARSAKEQLLELRARTLQERDEILREHAQFVSPRGPLQGR